MKGYYTYYGYYGWTGTGYMLFESDREYRNWYKENH